MYGSDAARSFYLLKRRANPQHPFSRFGAGSLDTLERKPKSNGIDVGERLVQFFEEKYRADKAVFVVVSPNDLKTLEKWVVPAFSDILSQGSSSSLSSSSSSSSPEIKEKKVSETTSLMDKPSESSGNARLPYPEPYP
eukprot:11189926-Ditylum_brightwellii.AAC.1